MRLLLLAAAAAAASDALAAAAPPPRRPRFVLTSFIDDFGFASASFNRAANATPPETRTPHLDALARDGVALARFHVHPFCSPSRASFLSGRLPVHVQQTNTMPDMPGAGVPFNMTTLVEFLRAAHVPLDAHVLGKYDVGAATARHAPEGRGFNGSLVYLSHAVDYFSLTDYCGSGGATPDCNCGDAFVDLWDNGAPGSALNGTAFADDLFLARALALIAAHNFSSGRTLYLHYNTHATHDPLQATEQMLAPLNYTADDGSFCNASVAASATGATFPGAPTAPASYRCRRTFEALTQWVDSAFGKLRAA
jgi:arylsulfatase A-like enzyme